jgi:hypothetical protein
MEEFEKLVAESFQSELIPAESVSPEPEASPSLESGESSESVVEDAHAEEKAG